MEIKPIEKSEQQLNDQILNYSVVATTFNDEDSIEQFIKEISSQTVPPKEIVIADGGSTDKTVEKLQMLSKNTLVPIKILFGKRLNIAEGYNVAIRATSEDYIGIAGIGNRYKEDYFEKLIVQLKDNDLDGAYSPIRGLNTTKFSRKYNDQLLNGEYGQRLEIASNHGVLIKKNIFDNLNYFYEKFIYAGEDTEFYLLAKKRGFNLKLVPEADMRWETPQNYRDFKKQIKVYSIAGLQIDYSLQLKMIFKHLLKFTVIIFYLFILLSLFILETDVRIRFAGCFATVIFIIIFHKKFKPLRLQQMYLQIYYTLTNLKYGKKEYEVRRQK